MKVAVTKITRRLSVRRGRRVRRAYVRGARLWLSLAISCSLIFGGCFRGEKGERFYGQVSAPAAQEFRWSDGGLPKVFDPARRRAAGHGRCARSLRRADRLRAGQLAPHPGGGKSLGVGRGREALDIPP